MSTLSKICTFLVCIALLGSCPISGAAQNKSKDKKGKAAVSLTASATTANKQTGTTKAGLMYVKQVDKDWYMEIPEKLLGKPLLMTARFIATPAGTKKYGGELFNTQTVFWEMAPSGKLLLRTDLFVNQADSTDAINRAVETSNEKPIIAAFTPEAHKGGRYLIKVTSLFMEDNPAFSPTRSLKTSMGLGSLLSSLSYIEDIRTFPTNTEVRLTKTWTTAANAGEAAAAVGKMTCRLNISFVRLPDDPMPRRLFDPRVGYFTDRFTHFGDDQQRTNTQRFITRWRLEPKNEADLERWKNGELIEPKKPIIYYIDPATPEKWRKYLIQGVNDWQEAFEQAGFKNAIMGKEWPTDRPDMSMEDARYSCIRYLASDIENAYGPHVHDPRTGEILESHICWYHNVMALLHDWYFVQASTLDEAAQQMQYDDELMGQLIRFVSSHEVGHTLGLRHNFGASSTVPVDSLRNKAWVEANGHTPSIMDYARFNYVAQPEDSISRKGIFPRIGPYDRWAIQWGYTLTPNAYDEESDHWEMEQLTTTKLREGRHLWFGDGETNRTKDPRCLTEDLGDDAIRASEYGILNLQREIKNLPAWTYRSNDINSDNLKNMYNQILNQFYRYANHVAASIGGVMADYKTVDEDGVVYTPVSKSRQIACLNYLDRQVFRCPEWLISEPYLLRITPNPAGQITSIGRSVLRNLVDASNLSALNENLTADELLPEVTRRLFSPVGGSKEALKYRRDLQSYYVSLLISNFQSRAFVHSSFRPAVLQELCHLQKHLSGIQSSEVQWRNHYLSLVDAINRALEIK